MDRQNYVVLNIKSSSYQDIILHVQYYSKANRARELVCVKQKFVEKVLFLTRFYCRSKFTELEEFGSPGVAVYWQGTSLHTGPIHWSKVQSRFVEKKSLTVNFCIQ